MYVIELSRFSLTEREPYKDQIGRMPAMELKIPTPPNFNFRRTVASHGWYQLPPFALDTGKWELSRVIDVGPKPPVTIFLTERKTHIRVNMARPITKSEEAIVLRDSRHILRLDDDLGAFY